MSSDFNLALQIISFIILLLVILYFLNNKYYKSNKFKEYIRIIGAIGSFMLATYALIAIITYKQNKNKLTYTNYIEFQKVFTNGIIQLFMDHPEMDYFYEEIFYKKYIKNVNRNFVLENQICIEIFTKCEEPIVMIATYGEENTDIIIIKETFLKILDLILSSPTVKNCYVNYFKKQFAGPIIIDFIEKNYGI